MKYLKLTFVMLCFCMVSCTRIDDDMEKPASKKTGFVYTVKKDGIEFKLSLLNEQGEPAVTFREGENFSFRFEMENLKKEDKRQYEAHLMGKMFAYGFCRVYTQSGDLSIAVFQNEAACVYVLQTNPFDGENRLGVTLPLYDDNEEWPNGTCVYRRNPSVALPKGSYSTGFDCTFEYHIPPVWDKNDPEAVIPPATWVETGPITMKIDFTIE